MTKHGQLLRDDRLAQRELLLQFLHRAPPAHEDFQHSDPRRMRECTEELRLEYLQLAGGTWLAASLPLLRHYYSTIY